MVEKRCSVCGKEINDDNIGVNYCGKYFCEECVNDMFKKLSLVAGDSIDKQLAEMWGKAWKKAQGNDQEAKADAGKPRLSLVPVEIIRCIARVREFAHKKYKDADSWKRVEKERYRDAMFRHLIAYIDNPSGKDDESGLPHLWHLACNVAFLCEMEKE